jgi:hypothetical protein
MSLTAPSFLLDGPRGQEVTEDVGQKFLRDADEELVRRGVTEPGIGDPGLE